jgi:uncharacterized membrane protein
MEDKINFSDLFKTAWRALLNQFWLLVGLSVGFTIIFSLILIYIIPAKGESISIGGVIVALLSLLLLCLFYLGFLKNCIQTLEGDEPQFSAYGQVSGNLFSFLIATILFGILIIIGLALLVVPGIYLIVRLQYFYAFMADEKTGIIESFKKSWEITKGQSLKLFLLMLLMLLISFAGMIAFVIGIFITTPLIALMYASVYRKLTSIQSKIE